MSTSLSPDAERFRRWQLAALDAHPAGTELRTVGPFRVVVPDAADEEPWVTLTEPSTTRTEVEKAVGELRAMMARRRSGWQIEYNEAVLPDMEPWLLASGFEVKERNPLMACEPDRFHPFAAPEVILSRLDPASPEPDLAAFQRIRWTDGGESKGPVPPTDQLRRGLTVASSIYLLARLDGDTAGTGVSHALAGAAEIVGVVTMTDKRRRGVAATVTSELVARHFAGGGGFVFLDASGEDAARVYERLGFTRFGANLIFG
ncbi:MAG: GNAT family N-acetyltransferase [Candidatus Dormibacterales bacterium]